MKNTGRQEQRSQTRTPAHCARRMPVWLPVVMLVVVLGGIVAWVWAMNREGDGPATATAPATATSPSALSANLRKHLVGRWLRLDGGYVLAITGIAEDGKVTATYANPRPINIARASMTQEADKTTLYVELRDRGYPGSYYTLNYDPGSDRFKGIYHHLGIGQNFDVSFERLKN